MRSFSFLICLLGVASLANAFLPSSPSHRPKSVLYANKKDTCDVAVFGGGFGGLYTALAISREAREKGRTLDVALVVPSDQFVFLPLLYDLTMGTASEAEVCPYYGDMLADTGVRQVKASFDCFASPDLYSANLTTTTTEEACTLSFRASVVAVGATPESILASVPGASQYVQPFYTQEDAYETRALLTRLESEVKGGSSPRIAIVGGGYGGVELAACLKRKLPEGSVSLLTRGAPMKGSTAEPLVDKALARLGVNVELCSVKAIEQVDGSEAVKIKRSNIMGDEGPEVEDDLPWDAVLWTAGSGPAYPVSKPMIGLEQVASGRIATDNTLRCVWKKEGEATGRIRQPPVWALGDCSEIIDTKDQPAVPKTAQAAMQQAETVASNVFAELQGRDASKSFQYQDLGSMLTLGGPNAAVLGPKEGSPLAPLFTSLLDISRVGLGLADEVLVQLSKSPAAEKAGLTSGLVERLGLSLGGYGLGVDADTAPGTLAGTLSGAARRFVYAIRMPTNRQRAYATASAAISTAAALAKEASDQIEKENKIRNTTE
jgi:NADH:ubiquinone reductase (non-electrogenic)